MLRTLTSRESLAGRLSDFARQRETSQIKEKYSPAESAFAISLAMILIEKGNTGLTYEQLFNLSDKELGYLLEGLVNRAIEQQMGRGQNNIVLALPYILSLANQLQFEHLPR